MEPSLPMSVSKGRGELPERVQGLDVQEAGDGFVVYQEDRDRIHYLNHTATLVLEACTGELDAAAIAGLVARAFSLSEAPVEDVEAVLEELAREGLVTWERRPADDDPTEPSIPVSPQSPSLVSDS